jgi:carboxypeptidase D
VGTGFSQGEVTANGEEAIAQDFVGFFKNFQTIFGIENHKIYVTGESYAGRYVPYVASAIIDQNDTKHFNLSGILIYDPTIGSFAFTSELAAYPFVDKHKEFFNYNSTFLQSLKQAHHDCGYADYNKKYLTFPPPGVQPPWDPNSDVSNTAACYTWENAHQAAFQMNPCFNEYLITGSCPILFDPLSFPTDLVYNYASFDGPYFNRPDVKEAMHAPEDVTWGDCGGPVFIGPLGQYGNSDTSLDPIQHVLPKVIEKTNRVLISEGQYDMSVIADSTLISIQNMTWNGQLGFQRPPPSKEIVIEIPDLVWGPTFIANGYGGFDGPGQGVMGEQHYERGLLYAITYQSGHMQPQFQPRVSYRHVQWLLGQIDTL